MLIIITLLILFSFEPPLLASGPTEEAVLFKYNKQPKIQLSLSSPPVETSIGYVRTSGILQSNPKTALLEIGGRGAIVQKGDRIGEFIVKEISEKGVILWLKS